VSLQSYVRQVGGVPTTAEQIEITKRRSRLLKRILDHQRKANQFLHTDSTLENIGISYEVSEVFVTGPDGEIDLIPCPVSSNPFIDTGSGSRPETFIIPMPSSMSSQAIKQRGLVYLAKLEMELRCGQCNDNLKGVRLMLGKKAFLFITKIRPKGPKTGKTKSWDAIHSTDQSLRLYAQNYRAARETLVTLGASQETLDRFQHLDRSHLKTSTTGLNQKALESKHGSLPWFWYMDVSGDSLSSDYMRECKWLQDQPRYKKLKRFSVHRINWLRAKAAFERATEENTLVGYEMKWTTAYFNHRAAEWHKRKEGDFSLGHQIYAAKQEAMWKDFANTARISFSKFGVI